MEIPEIGIKQINVPEVYIPEIYKPDPVLPVITNLEIDVVGCTYQHRDIKNTGNRNLLLETLIKREKLGTTAVGNGITSCTTGIKIIEDKEH